MLSQLLPLGFILPALIAVIGSPVPGTEHVDLAYYIDRPAYLEPRNQQIAGSDPGTRGLAKRQCVDTGKKHKGGNRIFNCDGKVVTMQDIHDKIAEKGYAAGRITMFYTKLGGARGVKASKCWAYNHPQWIPPKNPNAKGDAKAGFVMFDRVCDSPWTTAVVEDYDKHKENLGFGGDHILKCKSQALAEQAAGDVYFFIPKGEDAKPESAWTGWEFPALKRNDKVTNVWRVDPIDPGNNDRGNIWTKGTKDIGPEPRCKLDGTPR